MPRDPLDFYLLDTLADDIESFEDILELLNSTERPWRNDQQPLFGAAEVVSALLRCIRSDFIEALLYEPAFRGLRPVGRGALPSTPLEEAWFRLTPHGRLAYKTGDPNVQPPGTTSGQGKA